MSAFGDNARFDTVLNCFAREDGGGRHAGRGERVRKRFAGRATHRTDILE